jgi:hypothetical protein
MVNPMVTSMPYGNFLVYHEVGFPHWGVMICSGVTISDMDFYRKVEVWVANNHH